MFIRIIEDEIIFGLHFVFLVFITEQPYPLNPLLLYFIVLILDWYRLLFLILKLVNDFLDFFSGTLPEFSDMVKQSFTQLEVPLHIILCSYDLVYIVLELEIPSFLFMLVESILYLLTLVVVTLHILLYLVSIITIELGLTSVTFLRLIV